MLNLVLTTDKLQVITSAATNVDVHASGVDTTTADTSTAATWKQNTGITTATTTDVVAAPASNLTRNVKHLSIRNKDATLANTVTVQFNANATLYELTKLSLGPGEELVFRDGAWFHYDSGGGVMSSPTFAAAQLLVGAEGGGRIWQSPLPRRFVVTAGTEDFITVSGTAYYLYVGRVPVDTTVKFIELYCTTIGAGAQTAELGLFSTPLPPNKSAQTLTKLVATGTVDSLTATGVKRNTSSFAQLVAAGTYLWAAFRTAMATTQPKTWGVGGDYSEGMILTTTGGGALTGLSTAAGTIVAIAVGSVGPDLRVVLD